MQRIIEYCIINFENMLKKFLLLLLLSSTLYSAEIILKSGDAFICDIVEENDRLIKVKFKDKLYEIPKSEIQMQDKAKTGTHKGYTLSTIAMSDGTIVKGNIAEETKTTLTVQTILGYLHLDKTKIAEVQKPDSSIDVSIPKDYLEQSYRLIPHKFGIVLYSAGNGQPLAAVSPTINGGGIFYEPAQLNWKDKWQLGFQSEYLVSYGEGSRYMFYNQIFYLQYRQLFSRWLDFYVNLGIGGAYIRYKKDEAYIEGVQGLASISLGYQAIKFGKFTLRFGPRYTQYAEKPFYYNIGGEFALVYAL